MSRAEIIALAPLAMLGLTVTGAMLMVPACRHRIITRLTAFGLLSAAGLAILVDGMATEGITGLLAHDRYATFATLFAALTALAALALIPEERPGREAPALIALAALGAALLGAARHGASFFLGMEILSLALIVLFAFPLERRALEAAYKYFVLSGVASAALLLGLAFAYAETGSLAFAMWTQGVAGMAPAAAFLLAGVAVKLALVPFHMWAPDVFEGAPAAAALLSGGLAKGALIIGLVRLDTLAGLPAPVWETGLFVLAAASIIVGNGLALVQSGLARMLGYSSVAHAGYMAALLAAGGPRLPEAAAFYVATYAAALVATLGGARALTPPATADSLRGLLHRNPATALPIAVGLVSLAGLPISGGFVAKIYLFLALGTRGAWLLVGITAIGSMVGVFYYARFFTATVVGSGPARVRHRTWGLAAATLAAVAMLVILGIIPSLLTESLSIL